MPRFLLKLHNPQKPSETAIVEWSTIVDAPTSYGLRTEEEVRDFIKEEYGEAGLRELPARLERLERNGNSMNGGYYKPGEAGLRSILAGNRAGPMETYLNLQQLWDWYVVKQRSPE